MMKTYLTFNRHSRALMFARWLSARVDIGRVQVFVNAKNGTSTVIGY